MRQRTKITLVTLYVLATIQTAWCYLWLTRPYVNTALYEQGLERMPLQGRLLMRAPWRGAHDNWVRHRLSRPFALSHFWFPKPVQPEVMVQAIIDVACLLLAGFATTRMYEASSKTRVLKPASYHLFLATCLATYLLHTVQNFRFIYELPSLAFFATARYLLYMGKAWWTFVLLFIVATVNRETTLLLLPLYMITHAIKDGRLRAKLLVRRETLLVVLPLAALWIVWQLAVRHIFHANRSEFYPRLDWNIKSLLAPQAWPQLLSSCGYLLLLVVLLRRRIADATLQAWVWLIPVWLVFMFAYGILIETRVFGELIPFLVCATALILERSLLARAAGLLLPAPGEAEVRKEFPSISKAA